MPAAEGRCPKCGNPVRCSAGGKSDKGSSKCSKCGSWVVFQYGKPIGIK